MLVVGFLLTVVGGGLTAAHAWAAFREVTESGVPGLLRLAVHDATPLQVTLGAGESTKWLVRASLHDVDVGEASLQIDASGRLVDEGGVTARVDACSQHFDAASLHLEPGAVPCNGIRTLVVPPTALSQLARSGDRFELAQLTRDDPRELLVTLRVPATTDPSVIAGETALVGLGVHASGEHNAAQLESPGRLPATGLDLIALGTLALGMISLGIGLGLRGRQGAGGIGRHQW